MSHIVIVGPSASGKDFLRRYLQKQGYKFQPSYTTRKPRNGELDGRDYHFISDKQFKEMSDAQLFIEAQRFGDKQYGTTKEQFYETKERCVFIMSPAGLRTLSAPDRKRIYVIYLNPSDQSVRLQRMKERNMTEREIQVRVQADKEQFQGFCMEDLYGIDVVDPWFHPERLIG